MCENGTEYSFHDNYSSRDTLSGITFKRVLTDNADKKLTVLEAEVEGSQAPAVVILDKLPFTEQTLKDILSDGTQVENEMQNDVYGQYRLHTKPQLNPIKANIIHPATQKHIEKYTTSPAHLVVETEDLYQSVTLPFIQREQFSLDWVYNVLDKKKEADRIIFENTDPIHGFLMAPDFKWTGKQLEDLYCLAIVHRRGIKSLRDLNSSHLPLLYNLLNEGKTAIQNKYGLEKSRIRCYLHYQPSYYHLHVHFTNLEYNAPGINCEKSHMLETVIGNIERNSNYYQTAVLDFVVREKDKLYKSYQEHGYFSDTECESAPQNILQTKFHEEQYCSKILEFLEMIGGAKHEPSGELWETSYGESAWRMAILSLCLPPNIDRLRLVKLSLVSSFTSLGTSTDENTEWDPKCLEVTNILRSYLPARLANRLSSLFLEHVEVKRGRLNGSPSHIAYRGLLELEEIMLGWEEDVKTSGDADKISHDHILTRLANLKLPGSYRFKYFKDKTDLENFFTFVTTISKLMKLERTGWVNCKVRNPETVAGHMYRMGVLGLIFSFPTSQRSETLVGFRGDASIIGICHDMAECIIGDITPHCKVSAEEKAEKEMLAFQELVSKLTETVAMDLIVPFSRYENQKSTDYNAILTKDYDKFDMILQAFEYEKKSQRGPFLQQFFDSTMTSFKTDGVKKWQKCLLESRTKYFESDTTSSS